jgi:outer membrane assembly lipoprotein YfiO
MRLVHSAIFRLLLTVAALAAPTSFCSTKTATSHPTPTTTIDKEATHKTAVSANTKKQVANVSTPTKTDKKIIAKAEKKKKNKRIGEMTYDELKEEKKKLIAKGNTESAIKYIEKMVPLCSDLAELSDLMIELADLLFDSGNLAKAEHLYSEFASMYPGHKKAEYASYKAIICSYWETLDQQRDQSKTKETIEKAESFIKNKTIFTTYTKQVDEILYACRERLLESEISIFHYYLQRDDYIAAQTRLENIEKELLPALPTQEPTILSLACELAAKQNNTQLLEEKKAVLAKKFPDFTAGTTTPLVVAVADTRKVKHAADRF